jgi:hypothetical protein
MNSQIIIGLLINIVIKIEAIVNSIQIQEIVKLIQMNAQQHVVMKNQ